MFLPFIHKFFLLLFFFFFTLNPKWASAGLVINEFLADPSGSDAGQEFVEFLNTGPDPISLEGLEFQFANGAVGPEWETRWHCSDPLWLGSGELFLLVDRNWMGTPSYQDEVWLGLQNGPDAIRLILAGEVLDLVGYGPLTDEQMMEEQAADLPVGLSLMRKPDGHDSGNNADDFTSGEPTAGQVNFRNFEFQVHSLTMEPPSLSSAHESVVLDVVLLNTGVQDLPPHPMMVSLLSPSGTVTPVLETFFAGCNSGQSCHLTLELFPAMVGRFTLLFQLSVPATEEPLLVSVGKIQVGPGAVFLSEVMAAPGSHQGEWVEIQAGSEAINLSPYRIRDEEGTWRSLPQVYLEPGQFLLVAQDSVALTLWHQENLAQGIVLDCSADQMSHSLRQFPGSWPSLNNNPPESRSYADRVYLADEEGVVDQFTIPGDSEVGGSEGQSWERMSHEPLSFLWKRWRPSLALSGGTPGCLNSVAQQGLAQTENLEVVPKVLDLRAGDRLVHIRFLVGAAELGWHVEVYDLWGGLVRDLGGRKSGPGPGDLIWDGSDDKGQRVPKGGYVVVLLKSQGDGVFGPAAKQLVVVR